MEDAEKAVRAMIGFSSDFPGLGLDVHSAEDVTTKEGDSWDFQDWKSKDDRELFALQRDQALCRNHCLMVSSDVQYIQRLSEDAIEPLDFTANDEMLVEDYKRSSMAEKFVPRESLKVY